MEKYVLDTNLFFNMESGLGLAQKTETVIIELSKIIQQLKNSQKAEFFMPPKAVDELLSFFEDKNQAFLKTFLSLITIKSPEAEKITVSAQIISDLVADIRLRSYRGLQIAEEEMDLATQGLLQKNISLQNKKDYQISMGLYKKKLRDRYRRATRFGFIDSLTDLELMLLSLELKGYLISSDEGVVNWGRKFGVREIPAGLFLEHLRNLE